MRGVVLGVIDVDPEEEKEYMKIDQFYGCGIEECSGQCWSGDGG